MRRNLLLLAASLAALAALVCLVPPLREAFENALSGDTEALRENLQGADGLVVLFVITQIHAVVFYPTEIVNIAGGYVHGFWIAFPLLLALWTLSGVISYWLGKSIGRPLADRLFGAERIAAAEDLVHRGGIPILLAARLIPIIPFSLFSYATGAAHVPLRRFVWTSFVGYAPLTALVVLLGHRLDSFSPTDPLLWGAVVAIVAMFVVGHRVSRRMR